MARKVFISFLGTNNYVECHYCINGVLSHPVRFVQEALIEHECCDWSEKDAIYIFCTSVEKSGEKGSKELNWLDNGQNNPKEEVEKIGLKTRLDDLKKRIGLKPIIEPVDIKAGHEEKEIWDIFDTVYEKLSIGDHIYFDVTHAFRSIPLFSLVLFNYAKFMKETQVETILYGAFEKLGPAYKVREIPLYDRIAPVINLTDIVRLQEYNQIASSLKEFGRVKMLSTNILKSNNKPNQAIEKLCKSIKNLEEYINTISLEKIKKGDYIKDFKGNLKSIKKINYLPTPIANILKELEKETRDFVGKDDYQNIEAAINWTMKHDMLMQLYPLAQEYIVFRFADKFEDIIPNKLEGKDRRMFVSSILGMADEDFRDKNWKGTLAVYPEQTNIIASDETVNKIRPLYNTLTTNRNSLAHANAAVTYDKLIKDRFCVVKCLKMVSSSYQNLETTKIFLGSIKKIFINLSNHPISTWQGNQRDAISEYDNVLDISFPQILPDASSDEISAFVNKYMKAIKQHATPDTLLTVHVMGEMTFTYALVNRLKAEGITCVASTTERVAEEKDGIKTSEFKFVRFREY